MTPSEERTFFVPGRLVEIEEVDIDGDLEPVRRAYRVVGVPYVSENGNDVCGIAKLSGKPDWPVFTSELLIPRVVTVFRKKFKRKMRRLRSYAA